VLLVGAAQHEEVFICVSQHADIFSEFAPPQHDVPFFLAVPTLANGVCSGGGGSAAPPERVSIPSTFDAQQPRSFDKQHGDFFSDDEDIFAVSFSQHAAGDAVKASYKLRTGIFETKIRKSTNPRIHSTVRLGGLGESYT